MSPEEKFLYHALKQKKLAQAYLITASTDAGASELSEKFLNMIFCETGEGCENCLGCRKFETDNHVDLLKIDAEGTIKKEMVEDIPEFIMRIPYEGGYQCVYINKAHNLTKIAQNFLLKSIEEPPEYTVFVLSCSQPEKLLPTIVSRCVNINVRARSVEEVKKSIRNKARPGVSDAIAMQSFGSVKEADRLIEQGEFEAVRNAAFKVIRMLGLNKPSVFKMSEQIMGSGFLDTVFAVILIMRDALYYRLTKSAAFFMNPDRIEETKTFAKNFTSADISIMIDILLDSYEKKQICAGLNTKFLIENMIFKLLEVKKGVRSDRSSI